MTDETTSSGTAYETAPLSRRRFLRRAGVVGAAIPVASGLVAAACYNDPTGNSAAPTASGAGQNVKAGATVAPTAAANNWQKIDEEHKAGVVNFLKNAKSPLTKGKGMEELAPRLENGVKVWDLTMDEVNWEVAPGQVEKARGYNNQIPGPTLRATVGDKIRVNVKNNLTESSAIHWHGLYVPANMDGVPFVSQNPIEPGKTFTYEFTLRNQGSHMYHSHHNSADQVNRGMLGAFIVSAQDAATSYPRYDQEVIMILNDSLLGFTINGKGFPATAPIVAKKGQRLLIRWMNEGMMYHPMHLHGMPMEVFQRDGWPVTPTFKCDTIDVVPGQRMDCIIECTEAGLWAFHCHVLSHAEYEGGFFGLVTVLAIEDETFKVADILATV